MKRQEVLLSCSTALVYDKGGEAFLPRATLDEDGRKLDGLYFPCWRHCQPGITMALGLSEYYSFNLCFGMFEVDQ
jgi:hypothetical protein